MSNSNVQIVINGPTPLQRAYQNVLACQTGCNSTGIALSFVKDLVTVRQDEGLGTTETNRHPLALLYLHQLCFLATGRELLTTEEYESAAAWCRAKATGEKERAE